MSVVIVGEDCRPKASKSIISGRFKKYELGLSKAHAILISLTASSIRIFTHHGCKQMMEPQSTEICISGRGKDQVGLEIK